MSANTTSPFPSITTIANLFSSIRKSLAGRLSFAGWQHGTTPGFYEPHSPERYVKHRQQSTRFLHLFGQESIPVGTSRLEHLLRMLWRSTIFGDAFPNVNAPLISNQLQEVYREMAVKLGQITGKAMPLASPDLIKRYVQVIVA